MTTGDEAIPSVPLSDDLQASVQHLVDLAIIGLVQMFDEQARLFCYKLNGASGGLRREGESRRYTIISLLGLNRLEQAGVRSPIEIAPVLEELLSDTAWIDNIGDLGLLVWLLAHVAPDRLEELDERLNVRMALQKYSDAKRGQTMELAWLLTGLSYWGLARPEKLPGLKPRAGEVYERLKNNQGKHGIFGHASREGSLAGRARGWIGSFADQVYPIYAMALFSKAYENRGAAAPALQCGLAICEAQGEKGQWWWHYDSSSGHVIDRYPVFSVHQHGMAPMSLFLLGNVTGRDFGPWIYHGLEWINGRNELQFDMEDSSGTIVWRCIGRSSSPFKRCLNAIFEREGHEAIGSRDLHRVLFECRPYELGWLLYAFAGRIAQRKTPQINQESLRTTCECQLD
jgi:hypothetical protein